MQQSSVDPRTGLIDMDVIQTGVSAAERALRGALGSEVRALLEADPSARSGQGVRLAELLDRVNAQASVSVGERELRQALAELEGVARVHGGLVSLVAA
jgi:DNA replication licensing factor MCM4